MTEQRYSSSIQFNDSDKSLRVKVGYQRELAEHAINQLKKLEARK